MGAWGVGPLENDAALDVVESWKRFRAVGNSEESPTPENTIDHFLGAGLGDTMDWGDIDTTSRIIALAALFHRDGLPIRGKVKGYFEEAINWELRPDALSEWDDPKARRRALEDLLNGIGGVRRRMKRSKLFRHPALEFRSQAELLSKLGKWIRAFDAGRSADFPSDQEYPRLWQVLDRVLHNRIRHLGDDLLMEASSQRLILLSAYVGIQLQLPEREVLALIGKAKGRLIMGWSSDLGQKYRTSRRKGITTKRTRRGKK
jgi:hypothetical protein